MRGARNRRIASEDAPCPEFDTSRGSYKPAGLAADKGGSTMPDLLPPIRRAITLVLTVGAAFLPTVSRASVSETFCDPFQTQPHFTGQVRTSDQVLGFPIGSQEVTSDESDAYLHAVDQDSNRVVTGTLATSWQGRPLRYAIVGKAQNVTPAGLAAIRANIAALRDPATSDAQAAQLAASTPAILWVAANVHGSEESGTDASL